MIDNVDRMFDLIIRTSKLDLSKTIIFRNLVYLDIKHRRFEFLNFCKSKYSNLSIKDKSARFNDSWTEYVRHRGCSRHPVVAFALKKDVATQLKFDFFNSPPSPIFVMYKYTCDVNGRCAHAQSTSCNMHKDELRRYTAGFVAFLSVKDSQLDELFTLIELHLKDINLKSDILLMILTRIEACFNGHICHSCPGILVFAPSGTGKTHMLHSSSHFMLDTDYLNNSGIQSDPDILVRLVKSGFSVVSNMICLATRPYDIVTVAILPNPGKYLDILASKGVFKDTNFELIEAYKQLYDRKPAKFVLDTLLDNIQLIKDSIPYVTIGEGTTFSDALHMIYSSILADSSSRD